MAIITFTHIALAIVYFYLINWIGKESPGYVRTSAFARSSEAPLFTFLFRAVSPIVYIILVASVLYWLKLDAYVKNIYLVVVYHIAFRLFYCAITARWRLIDWTSGLIVWAFSIPASYFVYKNFVIQKANLLPDAKNLTNELWLLVILFLYNSFNDLKTSTEAAERRHKQYVHEAFEYYKRQFASIVDRELTIRNLEPLVYAVMIMEGFNRPKITRFFENIAFRIGRAKTLGVMQVTTDKFINDEESIAKGISLLQKYYDEAVIANQPKTETDEYIESLALYDTVMKYNPKHEYASEVTDIRDELVQQFYPDLAEKPSPI